MAKHAFLSASASHRWLACPPSAKLCAEVEDTGSDYAQQGTDAHTLCQYMVEKALGRHVRDPTEDLTWYDMQMRDCAEDYCSFVMEQIEEIKKTCEDPLVCIEERLDYSMWVEDGFGTGDCVIVGDGILHIIDFKYGVGVLVSAYENPQLKCYALGALDTYGRIYDIDRIRMTIYQPRRSNVDTYEMSTADLLRWADKVLAPTARLAYEGKGDFSPGEHCIFCKVKATCRARAEYSLALAGYDFKEPELLCDKEIADILPQIDTLMAWAEDVKKYALKQSLAGVDYPGYKLVEGRSIRKYTDEAAVAHIVEQAGYDAYEKKLLGITAMTKQLGKEKFDELLSGYVYKPQGKPALVPESDKRPEYNTAAKDFMEE